MRGYVERGWRLASGVSLNSYDTFYPAGTTYLFSVLFSLLGLFHGLQAIALLQPVLLAGANVLVCLIVLRITQSYKAALLTGILSTLYWPFSALGSFFLSEPAFIFFFLLAQLLYLFSFQSKRALLWLLMSGLLYGFSTLIRTPGLCGYMGAFLLLVFSGASSKWHRVGIFACGFALPILIQFGVNSSVLGKFSPVIATNGAYNIYLGQSRITAIGAFEQDKNLFYIFHNNNSFFDSTLAPVRILPVSITDVEFFDSEMKKLLFADPQLQLLRSVQNIVDIFRIVPRWPMRNVEGFKFWDVFFQVIFLVLVSVPAVFSLVGSGARRLAHVMFAGLPLVFFLGVIFISKGEPRYLIPFQYQILLLASFFYSEFFARGFRVLVSGRAVLVLGILFALWGAGEAVESAYKKTGFQKVDGSESHYFEVLKTGQLEGMRVRKFVELGYGRDAGGLVPDDSIEIVLEGFLPKEATHRNVHWRVAAREEGSVEFRFQGDAPKAVAFFLTDGDSFWRTVRVVSGEEDVLVDSLHDGRWVVLRVSEREVGEGRKRVRFWKLTGEDVNLSAVSVLE